MLQKNSLSNYQFVETYSNFGWHRTGWPSTEPLSRWLVDLLEAKGAWVELKPFSYPHFKSETSIVSDAKQLEAELLYFCWTGKHEIINPFLSNIDAHASEESISSQLDNLVFQAHQSQKDGLLIETRSPVGGLCGINRTHGTEYGFPIVLCSPDTLDSLRNISFSIQCEASVHQGSAQNIIAHFPGPKQMNPIIVTTPISGWFHCAGERGTGLVIAINVARRLSQEVPVDLILTSGHELGCLGGHDAASSYGDTAAAVVHIGSCVANIDVKLDSRCSATPAVLNKVTKALASLNLKPTQPIDAPDPAHWIGESQCWASKQIPMLSIAGQAPYFHTKGDRTRASTTPELLEHAEAAIIRAALESIK